MKKLLSLLMLSIIMMTSCENTDQFDSDLRYAYLEATATYGISGLVTSLISETWQKAIFENKTPSGRYCSDFNKALEELMDTMRVHNTLEQIHTLKDQMQRATSKLNDPPSSRQKCYDDFVSIVSDINALTRLATSPNGSLSSYRASVNETTENISKKIDDFNIKYSNYLGTKE